MGEMNFVPRADLHPMLALNRWGLLQLHALTRRLGRGRRLPPHLVTGERGEFEALFFLRRQGFLIVERRWRSPELRGDIDLIGWEGDRLCLVEVKTRTARDQTPALLAVDERKRDTLRQMARAYRRTLPLALRRRVNQPRFDVVSVYLLGARVECELLRAVWTLDRPPRSAA